MQAVAGAIAFGAAVTWAGVTVFSPAAPLLENAEFTLVEVMPGEVGASLNLNTVATWTTSTVATNLAAGTVTSVLFSAGQEATTGSLLYAVDLRPVAIAEGATPAFRPLSRGLEGPDVSQLQVMLATLGHYPYEVDGTFDWVTERAVKEWQRSLGLSGDGVIQAGDILFTPKLPLRLSLDPDVIHRGAVLSGGEEAVQSLPDTPNFHVPVSESQAAQIPDGTRVEIAGPNGEAWDGVVAERRPQEQASAIDLVLVSLDGNEICDDACGSISVSEMSLLRSEVITIETVTGLVVPTAALRSAADGTIFVLDELNNERTVVLVAGAKGMSVIEGLQVGDQVRLPAPMGE